MPNLLSNKKKIRGWKRRIKAIQQWKLRCLNLDMEQLEHYNRDDVKLRIDPFCRLPKRNPPVWFSRIILAAMIEVYFSWHQKLSELNEPFYLKIWLYSPHFIHSQIVAAFRDNLHFYDNTFYKSSEDKAFPATLFGLADCLEELEWQLYVDADYYMLSELREDAALGHRKTSEIEAIQSKAYRTDSFDLETGKDSLFSVRVGDVWVGGASAHPLRYPHSVDDQIE